MSDVEGLEEFGGLARWRDVLLRLPDGSTETSRLIAFEGRLPSSFDRPLNQARTAYERFALADLDTEPPVYIRTNLLESPAIHRDR